MRENRTYGSEGRETGNSTGLPYPYQSLPYRTRCRRFAARLEMLTRIRARPRLSASVASRLQNSATSISVSEAMCAVLAYASGYYFVAFLHKMALSD